MRATIDEGANSLRRPCMLAQGRTHRLEEAALSTAASCRSHVGFQKELRGSGSKGNIWGQRSIHHFTILPKLF